MEFLLPSILTLLAGAFVVLGIFPSLSKPVLVFIAIAALLLVIKHHMDLFEDEYKNLTIIDSLKFGAPTVLTVLVVLLLLGYILLGTGFLGGPRGSPEAEASAAPEVPSVSNNRNNRNNGSKSNNNNKKNGSLGTFFSKYA